MIREYIYFVDDNPNGTSGMTDEEIVRCKECRHCYVDGEQVKFNACELNHNKVQSDDWFCADGEREGE